MRNTDAAGGTVSVSLKSGTNQLHGTVYEYNRNNALTANTLDSNRIGAKKAEFKWNQPGFELDGPVVNPHLYNGRNKTFFMYSYEIIRDKIPSPLTTTVPMPRTNWRRCSSIGPLGRPVTAASSWDSVRCTPRPGLPSMSTPARISSTAMVAVRAAI